MLKDLSKNIKFRRITLKNFINLNEEELKLVLQWRNHENVRKFASSNPKKISLPEHKKFIKKLKKSADRYYFLVKDARNYLGVISLLNIDFYNKRCLWGDYANPDNVNTGIGIILEYAALCLVFDVLNLHYLRCETIEQNKTALKLHKFFGFNAEGVLRDYMYRDNEKMYYNVVVMSIVKEQWITKKPGIEQLITNFLQK